jgi:hypothetical protein
MWVGFAAWTAYVAFFEIMQLAYAAPACLLLISAQRWLLRGRPEWGSLRRAVLGWSAIVAVLVSCELAWMASRGQLAGYSAFFRTIADQADYSSQPANLLSWFGRPRNREGLLLLVFVVLCTLAPMRLILQQKARLRLFHFLPLALAASSALLLQKQLMRAGISSQLLPTPLLGLTLLGYQTSGHRWLRPRAPAVAALVSGYLFFTCFVESGWLRQLGRDTAQLPRNVAAVLWRSSDSAELQRRYFAPETVSVGYLSGDELRSWLHEAMGSASNRNLFVLGDEAYAYIATASLPPPYLTIYNQSILYSQNETLAWLERERPGFVLWQPGAARFDDVPNHVRVPLLFAYVAEHYVPVAERGGFALLRRRESEPLDLTFWTKWLGSRVDLGYIPSESGALRYAASAGGDRRTSAEFLVVTNDHPQQGQTRSAVFAVGGQTFAVDFRERPPVTKYYVRLDRLWFYDVAKAAGYSPRIEHGESGRVALNVIGLTENVLY